MELEAAYAQNAAGAVDGTGPHKAKVQVQNQDGEHGQAYHKAQFGQGAEPLLAAKEIQAEDKHEANGHHLQLIHHDGHAVYSMSLIHQSGGG